MENLREIIEKHITQDIELLSVKIDSSLRFIKVVIDSANDISVDKTAMLAKEIKNNEDILSNFPNGVRLEVGTPGIGSRLEKNFQYKKNIGRKIELEYRSKDNTIKETFLLIGNNETGINVKDGKVEYYIDYSDIISARVKISFD
jgi:ribosome maturation factor RimP